MPLPRSGPRQSLAGDGLAPLALFAWRVETAPSLVPDTRQTPTFSRASSAMVNGGHGQLVRVPPMVPAFTRQSVAGTPARTFLRVEPAATNLVAAGETFDTNEGWTTVGGVLVTPAARRVGHLGLARIEDTNTSGWAHVAFAIAGGTFSGNGTKVISFYVARGVAPNADGATVQLRDTTANASRVKVGVQIDPTGTTCTATVLVGTLVSVEAVGAGVFRVAVASTSVTAANTHAVRVYGALENGPSSAIGDMLFGGVQLEERSTPTSYVPRPTTGDSGTRAADLVSWDWLDTRPPAQGDLTLVARYLLNVGDAAPATERTVLAVGTDAQRLALAYSGTDTLARYKDNAVEAASSVDATPFGNGIRQHAGAFSRLATVPRVEASISDTFATASDAASGWAAWPSPSFVRVGLAAGVLDPVHLVSLAVYAGRHTYADASARY